LGIEGGVMKFCKAVLAGVVVTPLLLPVTACAENDIGTRAQSTSSKQSTNLPKAKKPRATHRWRGYGFLPGYRPPPDNLDLPGKRRSRQVRYERRYWHNGQIYYGWGYPGYYRGRWNGGGFGPCWTPTPIGMMPTC
jgi:hypothetical protein